MRACWELAANAGADTVNCIKQATEFGLNRRMRIAPLIMFLQDVHSMQGSRPRKG